MKRILLSRLVSASVIIAIVGALSVAAVALPGSPFDDSPSTSGDISGNCDEAEHANDVECGGTGAVSDDDNSSTLSGDDSPSTPGDISGNCDEAEHANDVECGGTGAVSGDDSPSTPGDISGNCDEAEHANDVECGGTGAVSDDDNSSTPALDAAGEVAARVGQTEEIAGTVAYSFDAADGTFTLGPVAALGDWTIAEQRQGLQIEVRFTKGTKRVDVHIEIEHGVVRERVRTRDRADDSETRVENGTVTRVEPGSDDSSSGSGLDSDDNSGSGSGSDSDDDDDDDDDDDNSGSGSGSDSSDS